MASVKIGKKIIFLTVKNGIKLIYICVTMIGQAVLSKISETIASHWLFINEFGKNS
jgi:hypothetical protein